MYQVHAEEQQQNNNNNNNNDKKQQQKQQIVTRSTAFLKRADWFEKSPEEWRTQNLHNQNNPCIVEYAPTARFPDLESQATRVQRLLQGTKWTLY